MSYFQKDVLNSINEALKTINFEQVSELSKEEFAQTISKCIFAVVNSTDFRRYIKEQSE